MKSAWVATFNECRRQGIGNYEARRLTNLLIAAMVTASSEDEAETIAASARKLMMYPTVEFTLSKRELCSLAEFAMEAVMADAADGIDFDGWVREFQLADAGRKSLGAYATPASFANAVARAALPEGRAADHKRIIDPACGAGALLIACLDRLHPKHGVARRRAALRLYGMELDPAARELACLHIWIASGARTKDLTTISNNIRCENALLHDWIAEEPYDVLVMNPPWESLRHKPSDPTHGAAREATVRRIDDRQPGADGLPKLFSAQGTGDRNLCKAFIELAPHLLVPGGRIAALIPGAFSSDEGMLDLRRMYLSHFALETWTAFENRGKAFDIDSRYKFGILVGERDVRGTQALALRAFAVEPAETLASHVLVNRADLAVIGGPVEIIPDITSQTELAILRTMLTSGTPFFAEGELGDVRYRREVDLTLGRHKGIFERLERRSLAWNEDCTLRIGSAGTFVPVMEGRMVGQYDFFQKSWVVGEGRTAVWRDNGDDPLDACRPQFVARPMESVSHRLAICDVTSATNSRTVHATVVPDGWMCGNTAPVLRFSSERAMYAGLAILNSLTFDWLARRMVSGLHLNKFYLSCMTWPAIGSDELSLLSTAGKQLAAGAPRCPLGLRDHPDFRQVDLRALIEATVAAGYGLQRENLVFMLSSNRSDRRGFWRYYAAVPQARDMAQRAADLLARPAEWHGGPASHRREQLSAMVPE